MSTKESSSNDGDGSITRRDVKGWRDRISMRYFLIDKRYSQSQTADVLGTSEATINKWFDRLGFREESGFGCRVEWCGEVFDTLRQEANHYKQSGLHEGDVPQVKVCCSFCGEDEYRPPSLVNDDNFCSDECEVEWRMEHASVGEDHNWWAGGKVTVTCVSCERPFEVYSCRADTARFCERECERDYMGAEPVGCICEWCDAPYYVSPRRADNTRFCSASCRSKSVGEWLSENHTGQNHPSWRGGYSIYLALVELLGNESWNKTRGQIRERDQHTCQMCGRSRKENGRALSVHHLIPIMSGGTHASELLMSLCRSCHQRAEGQTLEFTEPILTDWSDDELPEGRERWTPDDTPTEIQPTLDSFAPADG